MIPLKTQVPAEQTAFSLGAAAEEGVAAVRYYPLSETQHLPPSFSHSLEQLLLTEGLPWAPPWHVPDAKATTRKTVES